MKLQSTNNGMQTHIELLQLKENVLKLRVSLGDFEMTSMFFFQTNRPINL